MPRRLRLVTPRRSWELDQLVVAIGRGAANDVVFDDPEVARSHATVLRIADEFFLQVEDAGSPVRVNDAAVEPEVWRLLSDGDRLGLGSMVVEVGLLGEPRPGAGLVVMSGPQRGSVFALKGEVLVGRAPHCDLHVADPLVAPEQVRLRPAPGGEWTVLDVSGRPGALVNDAPLLGEHRLAHRDRIRLGDTWIVLLSHGAEHAATRPAPSPKASPLIGRQLGPYRLERVIGRGGMGIVFEALDTRTKTPCALKLLADGRAQEPGAVERFLREARLASEIPHDGIVQVSDSGRTAEGTPYLVMELLCGESLADRLLREGRFAEPEVRRIGGELAEIMATVHAAGVVHRDLKPDNVFLARTPEGDEVVRLLDLGIAKALGMEELTKTGELMGTAAYLAPELCMNARMAGPRVDVYALGCILFEMATGRTPFVGNVLSLMQQHLTAPVPKASSLAPVSAELDEIIDRCLRKRPEARLPSMIAVRRELAGRVFRKRRAT